MRKFCLYPAFFLSCLYINAQTTESRPAISDNSIYSDNTNNSNGIGENIFSGQTSLSGNRRALIKFSFPGVPPGGGYVVSSATLKLYCNSSAPTGGPANMNLHSLTKDWGEGISDAPGAEGQGTAATAGDATWLNAVYNTVLWTNPGGDYNATASATTSVDGSGVTYSWSSPQLITDVQNWMNLVTPNYGWILIGDEATPASAKRFGSRENADLASRPVLEITYTVIPVKLVSFSARETKHGALLNWQTAQEYNNDFFSVEHSMDGIHFNSVAIVNGVGFSLTIQNYSYLHAGALPGINYYRLVQTDKDGKKTLSHVVSVLIKKQNATLLVANIVGEKIIIRGNAAAAGSNYAVFNALGTAVLSGKLSGNSINAAVLPKGFYFVKMESISGEKYTERFFKQ